MGAIEVKQGVCPHSQFHVRHHRLIEQHAEELRFAACTRGHIKGAEADLVSAAVMTEVSDAAAASFFYIDKDGTETACPAAVAVPGMVKLWPMKRSSNWYGVSSA